MTADPLLEVKNLRLSVRTDLPQPDSPTTPRIWPRATVSSTWRAARSWAWSGNRAAASRCAPRGANSSPPAADRRSSRTPQPRVDDVAQAVTQQVEAEYGKEDGKPRKGREPPRLRQVLPALGDGEPPVGIGRRGTHAEEA